MGNAEYMGILGSSRGPPTRPAIGARHEGSTALLNYLSLRSPSTRTHPPLALYSHSPHLYLSHHPTLYIHHPAADLTRRSPRCPGETITSSNGWRHSRN